MTREEAIRLLSGLMFKGKLKEALDMAIKALEQEPTTKNDLGVDREEAIETLKENLCAMCAYGSQCMESCDIKSCDNRDAIKALEQELTTKNDLGVDAISREQAINEFCIYNSYDSIGVDKVRSYLKALPSVTPQEPKIGHWIDDTRLGYHVSVCSNCNWRGHGDTCLIYKPKYCPNCGSYMYGVEPQ